MAGCPPRRRRQDLGHEALALDGDVEVGIFPKPHPDSPERPAKCEVPRESKPKGHARMGECRQIRRGLSQGSG